MKFLIDESADARLASYLNECGYDATLVARHHRPGIPDWQVLMVARSEDRVLITDDRDFGDLVFRQHQPHAGIIYFRLGTTLLETRIDRLQHVLTRFAGQLDQFLFVTERTVRIRHARP